MSELAVKGKITKILDLQTGTTKDGKEWQKQLFLLETEEKYNNLYCFEIFGAEKVDKFKQYNSVGKDVLVKFNVSTNEWQGKYFTSLSAWSVFSDNSEGEEQPAQTTDENEPDGLPF